MSNVRVRVTKSGRMRCGMIYKVLVEKPEGKKSLGRPMHRWENDIKYM
jgi:hypothetical protein